MTDTSFIMTFGKHKGEDVSSVPRDYLNWLLEQDWFPKHDQEHPYHGIMADLAMRDQSYDTF